MVEKITKGIHISVRSKYEGKHFEKEQVWHVFSYAVVLENRGDETVQLLSRNWEIFDSLNEKNTVMGKGVVGQMPILEPNQSHRYQSNCLLNSSTGAMKGHYNMIRLHKKTMFKATIPTFQLTACELLN